MSNWGVVRLSGVHFVILLLYLLLLIKSSSAHQLFIVSSFIAILTVVSATIS